MNDSIEELTIPELLKTKFRKMVIRPLGKESALGQASQGIIMIDPRRSAVARTVLHELIHVRRPFWSENKVLNEERRLWKAATWREKAQLLLLLAKGKVWESEEENLDGDTL